MSRRPLVSPGGRLTRTRHTNVASGKRWSESPVNERPITRPHRSLGSVQCYDVYTPPVWAEATFRIRPINPTTDVGYGGETITVVGGTTALSDSSDSTYVQIPVLTHHDSYWNYPSFYHELHEENSTRARAASVVENLDQDVFDYWLYDLLPYQNSWLRQSRLYVRARTTSDGSALYASGPFAAYTRLSGSAPIFNKITPLGNVTAPPGQYAATESSGGTWVTTATSDAVFGYDAPEPWDPLDPSGQNCDLHNFAQGVVNGGQYQWWLYNTYDHAVEYFWPGTFENDYTDWSYWTLPAYNSPPSAPMQVLDVYMDVTVMYIVEYGYWTYCPEPPGLYPGCDQYTNFTEDGGGGE